MDAIAHILLSYALLWASHPLVMLIAHGLLLALWDDHLWNKWEDSQ